MLRYVWIVLAVLACKYPDPGSGDAAIDAAIDADLVNGAYVVVHTTLDGATTKVAVVPSLDVFDEVDLSGARTFGAGTRVFMANEKVFVATDLTIRRFAVVDYGLVEEGATINFLPTGVTAFTDSFFVLDDTNAWYFDQRRFEAYALDLDLMESSTAIYYQTLNFLDREAFVTGAYYVKAANLVYVPYHFRVPTDPLFVESELYVAEFSKSGASLLTPTSAEALRNNKCARSRPFARLGDTLFLLGDIGWLHDLAPPQPQDPNCVLRIDPDAPHEIDFNFYINMDTQTSPSIDTADPVQVGNQVFTWARENTSYTSQAEWDTTTRWTPQISTLAADGTSMTTEQVTADVLTIGAPGRTFYFNGHPYFLVPNTTLGGSSLMAEAAGAWIEHARFPGTVTLIERVR